LAEPDHSDVLLRLVVIERDGEVCREAQHVFLVRAQPVQQSPWLGLRDVANGFRVGPRRRLDIPCREDLTVALPERVECFFPKTGLSARFGLLNLPVGASQDLGHLFRPPQIRNVFTDFPQAAVMVRIA